MKKCICLVVCLLVLGNIGTWGQGKIKTFGTVLKYTGVVAGAISYLKSLENCYIEIPIEKTDGTTYQIIGYEKVLDVDKTNKNKLKWRCIALGSLGISYIGWKLEKFKNVKIEANKITFSYHF